MLERGETLLFEHLDKQKLSSAQAFSCSWAKISMAKLETPRRNDYLLFYQMSYADTWPLEGILYCRVKHRHTAREQHHKLPSGAAGEQFLSILI